MERNLNYYLEREQIQLTGNGVFFENKQILPISIQSIKIFHNYLDENKTYHIFCEYGYKNILIDTNELFTFTYDPQDRDTSLKELRKQGISLKDKNNILFLLTKILERTCSLSDKAIAGSEIIVERFYRTNRSGWFLIDNQLLYLTAEFAITSAGIKENWCCTAPNAYLYFDDRLSPKEAYTQILEFLDLDFQPASLIFSTVLLSLLSPFRRASKLYPSPGMLISGSTSTGKTELAIHLAHILTKKTGALNQIFILQRSTKNLDNEVNGLSDTTFILDDIRLSQASNLRQNIASAIDSIVRSCFLEDNTYCLIPVLTGEREALCKQLASWMNRIIEVPLDTFSDSIKERRELIRKLHEHPLLIRTFIRHFLEFLARSWKDNRSAHNVFNIGPSELEEQLSDYLLRPEENSRSYDNLLLSFWSFQIFIQYGLALDAIQKETGEVYIENYKENLCFIHQNQEMHDPQRQLICMLLTIVNKMRINLSIITERRYLVSENGYQDESCGRTYGHTSFINYEKDCSGVFIKDSLQLSYASNTHPPKTLLVLSCKVFETLFLELMNIMPDLKKYFPYRSLVSFEKALSNKNLLLGQDRHDKNGNLHFDYRIEGYPCYADRKLCNTTKVFVFQLEGTLAVEVEKMCLEFLPPDFERSRVCIGQIKHCTKLLESLI